MLGQSYISKKEKLMPPCKAAKARLTLLFGGSASGDMKLKPLLVYHSEKPRALKNIARALSMQCERATGHFSRSVFSATLFWR